jgi:uracil-DNA glycosylase
VPVVVAKTLRDPIVQQQRLAGLEQPHIASLTAFVRALREEVGPEYSIPYFDPADGGKDAEILFLLEAPGPRAVRSKFVSRNNPDETAKNFLLLCEEAGIDRRHTVCWNVVPWYIGTGSRIRPATSQDVASGLRSLGRLLELLPRLSTIVLVGGKAARARGFVVEQRPQVSVVEMPHPSPMFINRSPGNRDRIRAVLRQLAARIAEVSG